MAHASLVKRVEILEQQVESLKELPARMTAVEGQIVQLRGEMHDGFSALTSGLRSEMREADLGLREQIDDVRLELRAWHHETLARFEDLDRLMRVLHEDTLERIARLDEGRG